MRKLLSSLTLLSLVVVMSGCTPTCKGDSCSRPQANERQMVIWWPEQMRVEPGPSGERADYQTISLER